MSGSPSELFGKCLFLGVSNIFHVFSSLCLEVIYFPVCVLKPNSFLNILQFVSRSQIVFQIFYSLCLEVSNIFIPPLLLHLNGKQACLLQIFPRPFPNIYLLNQTIVTLIQIYFFLLNQTIVTLILTGPGMKVQINFLPQIIYIYPSGQPPHALETCSVNIYRYHYHYH